MVPGPSHQPVRGQTSPRKREAIRKLSPPTTVQELKRTIGQPLSFLKTRIHGPLTTHRSQRTAPAISQRQKHIIYR